MIAELLTFLKSKLPFPGREVALESASRENIPSDQHVVRRIEPGKNCTLYNPLGSGWKDKLDPKTVDIFRTSFGKVWIPYPRDGIDGEGVDKTRTEA